jgi:ABC-type nitrate/sulfonate/bicarbonate transport system substrate-binding protein
MSTRDPLRIGFIPLVDAASVLIAADKGFAAAEGLDITLIQEVSWANVREKLNAGLFDAAHLLAPMAIASALGDGQGAVPLMAPYILALNGNAITVSTDLNAALMANLGGEDATPLATAHALAEVVTRRRSEGRDPLCFGMTFPFSCHNYLLRFWMAAAGINPDEDVRLIVLPPPYMVESLRTGEVDGFCVGAPWNSVAVDFGLGHILHFGCEIVQRLTEKVLAVRETWAEEHRDILVRLMSAIANGANFVTTPENWDECAVLLSRPGRIGAEAQLIRRTLSGTLKVAPDGQSRSNPAYLVPGLGETARPDPAHAVWLYGQMVHWRQTDPSKGSLAAASKVLSPELFSEAFPNVRGGKKASGEPADGLGAFYGPPFGGATWDAFKERGSTGQD